MSRMADFTGGGVGSSREWATVPDVLSFLLFTREMSA